MLSCSISSTHFPVVACCFISSLHSCYFWLMSPIMLNDSVCSSFSFAIIINHRSKIWCVYIYIYHYIHKYPHIPTLMSRRNPGGQHLAHFARPNGSWLKIWYPRAPNSSGLSSCCLLWLYYLYWGPICNFLTTPNAVNRLSLLLGKSSKLVVTLIKKSPK